MRRERRQGMTETGRRECGVYRSADVCVPATLFACLLHLIVSQLCAAVLSILCYSVLLLLSVSLPALRRPCAPPLPFPAAFLFFYARRWQRRSRSTLSRSALRNVTAALAIFHDVVFRWRKNASDPLMLYERLR